MSKEINKLFEKAQKQLKKNDGLKTWLCFVFGVMSSSMTKGHIKLMKDHLNLLKSV